MAPLVPNLSLSTAYTAILIPRTSPNSTALSKSDIALLTVGSVLGIVALIGAWYLYVLSLRKRGRSTRYVWWGGGRGAKRRKKGRRTSGGSGKSSKSGKSEGSAAPPAEDGGGGGGEEPPAEGGEAV